DGVRDGDRLGPSAPSARTGRRGADRAREMNGQRQIVRSRDLKFKHMRHHGAALATLSLLLAGLAGCAGVTTSRTPTTPAPLQPLAHLTVATPTADHDVMAQLLDAQF